jgi:hypothetical protein
LVKECHDPSLRWYVIENIGQGVPVTSKYHAHFQQIRSSILQTECALQWQLSGTKPKSKIPTVIGKVVSPSAKLPQAGSVMTKEKLKKWLELEMQLVASAAATVQAEYNALLRKQFKQLAALDEMLAPLLRDLANEEPAQITAKLQDDNPWVRWLAIHVVAKKWLPVERELIALLNDSYPGVRDAARQALVRLSRGNDFGPVANPTAVQVTQAQAQWQTWLDLQIAIRQPADYQ